MKLKRRLLGPDDGGPSHGRDVVAVKRGLNKVETDFFPRPPGGFDRVYNRKAVEAVSVFQRINNLPDTGIFNQATLDDLAPYMDAYAKLMYASYVPPRPKPKVPELGPVWPGGASILFHSLTHETDGFPNPAHPDGPVHWLLRAS